MVDKFIHKINDNRIARENLNRVKLKDLDTGSQNPKAGSQKFTPMWGIGIERSKKTIMATTQNSVCDVTRPLTKRFRTRQ